jgi:hypothetical protein
MTINPYGNHIRWLPEEEYQKLLSQTRLKFNGVFAVFHGYGQDVFVPEAIKQSMDI